MNHILTTRSERGVPSRKTGHRARCSCGWVAASPHTLAAAALVAARHMHREANVFEPQLPGIENL